MLLCSTLPVSWKSVPLKSVATYEVSNVDKHAHDDELAVRLCNYTDVYKNERITLDMELMWATATENEISKFHLEEEDVVITKDSEEWSDIAVPALISETADDLVCGYHLAFIRSKPGVLSGRYLFRAIQSRPVALQLELASTGVTRCGLPKGAIGAAKIPLPPLPNQLKIADFLDSETARIDSLVEAKESMLDLIGQKRSALINNLVTRGLNPEAPIKSSGLDWLRDIPQHWEIERAKNLFSVRDERSKEGDEELLSVSHITGVTSRASKEVNMFLAESMTGYKKCQKDDFVTNTLWAWMGAMGISPLDGIVSPDYHVYESKGKILPEFMELLCRSKPFVAEVTRWSKGVWSSRLRLYPENFFEIRFPVPPHEEQEAIVAEVAVFRDKTTKLTEALIDSIRLLKERRSALITAAVNGEIPLEEMVA
ncbi:restriction endonuclease subunit S [Arenicella xantha]|nr:restriction endonuclease subunit S [Arenicella xantha]